MATFELDHEEDKGVHTVEIRIGVLELENEWEDWRIRQLIDGLVLVEAAISDMDMGAEGRHVVEAARIPWMKTLFEEP